MSLTPYDAGFANIATLRANVLREEMADDTEYDTHLLSIGRGVAAQFAKHCGRKFDRAADTVEDFSLIGSCVQVSRYPIESIASVGVESDEGEGFDTSEVLRISENSGLVYLHEWVRDHQTVRITYTGGYWWDTTEDSSGTMPEGAAPVPDDLLEAWVQQVQHTASERKIFDGLAATEGEINPMRVANIAFLPWPKAVVDQYRTL